MEPEVHKKPLRFYEIDLLRFLAALSVVLFHYTYRGYMRDHFSPVAYTELGRFTKYGFLGVQLFFIISGYVVLMSAHGKTIKQFFLSRVTRLYPAFWVALALTFTVVRLIGPHRGAIGWSTSLDVSLKELAYNATMLQDFFGVEAIDSSYWSLGVEIGFYFLIALVIGWNLYSSLPWLLLAWLGLAALLGPTTATTPAFAVLFFPKHAPYFVAGMLFYMIQQQWFAKWKLYGLLGLSFVLALRSVRSDIADTFSLFGDPTFSLPVAALAITSFYGVFWLLIHRILNLQRYTWLATLGALTYPLYLVHASIGFVLFQRFGPTTNNYLLLGLLLVLMLTLAVGIHQLEKRLAKPLGKAVGSLLSRLAN